MVSVVEKLLKLEVIVKSGFMKMSTSTIANELPEDILN